VKAGPVGQCWNRVNGKINLIFCKKRRPNFSSFDDRLAIAIRKKDWSLLTQDMKS
jgi:hypothetical protein